MLTLAIETSGIDASVALTADDALLGERELPKRGRRHAQQLAPAVQQLFASHDRSPRDCDLVAVSIGPGSFTGLRVGVSFAKAFAYAAGAKLAAVDTYLAVAENSPVGINQLIVIGDALREEVFVGRYVRQNDGWQREETIRIEAVEGLSESLPQGTPISGPGLRRFGDQFAHCEMLDESLWIPRPAVVAELGVRSLRQDDLADAAELEPLYLRRSYAEEKRGT